MSARFTTFIAVLGLAAGNVRQHKARSAVIAFVVALTSFLLVTGASLMSTIDHVLETNVTETLSGHLQVYSAEAPEAMQLYGSSRGLPDIGKIDFAAVEPTLLATDGVRALVPMVFGNTWIVTANVFDTRIERLREQLRRVGSVDPIELRDVRFTTNWLTGEPSADLSASRRETFQQARDDEFWRSFDIRRLESLENEIAPELGTPEPITFSYLATLPERFAESFERFSIVHGTEIPAGKRGLLLNKMSYERSFKHPSARQFDTIYDIVVRERRAISDDYVVERGRRLAASSRHILAQLSEEGSQTLHTKLSAYLRREGSLAELLYDFLSLTRSEVSPRRDFFYEHIAPLIRLYDVKPGDVVTLQSASSSGYPTSSNVRLYGIYEYRGVTDPNLAGQYAIVDLLTHQGLAGYGDGSQQADIAALQKEAGLDAVDSGSVEDTLFKQGTLEEAGETSSKIDVAVTKREVDWDALLAASYPPSDFLGVSVSNVAVFVDPSRMETVSAALRLGLGKEYQVIGWRKASGEIAEYFDLTRWQLYFGLATIFCVAFFILNTVIVAAMLNRISEIGTLRALGASPLFVAGLLLAEALLTGALGAGLGTLSAVAVLDALAAVGLPAPGPAVAFLFGGPRLMPAVDGSIAVIGWLAVVVAAGWSAMYPALLSARIEPVLAIRGGS